MSADLDTGDMDEMLKEMENDAKKTFTKKFWSLPSEFEGTQKIRFLPQSKKFNEKVFYKKHKMHWLNGKAFECLAQTMVDKFGVLHEAEDCPICKHVKKLYAIAGDEKESEEKRIASSIGPKDRYIFRIIVRGKKDKDGNNAESKPEFYEAGKTIFESLFNILKDGEYGNFLSISEGRDYNLSKRGKGRMAKYEGSMPSANVSPVFSDKAQIMDLVKNIEAMNFDQLIEFASLSEVKAALNEFISPGEQREEESTPHVTVGEPHVKKATASTADAGEDIDDILDSF